MEYFDDSYPTKGQVLIHELTHAWQIQTKRFAPGVVCKRITQTNSYTPGPAGTPWSDFGLEQQAAIVDHWFHKYADKWGGLADLIAKLASEDAIHDPYFVYIANNIRFAQN